MAPYSEVGTKTMSPIDKVLKEARIWESWVGGIRGGDTALRDARVLGGMRPSLTPAHSVSLQRPTQEGVKICGGQRGSIRSTHTRHLVSDSRSSLLTYLLVSESLASSYLFLLSPAQSAQLGGCCTTPPAFLSHLWSFGLPLRLQLKTQSFQMLNTVILRDHTVYPLDHKHSGTAAAKVLMPVAGSVLATQAELSDNH